MVAAMTRLFSVYWTDAILDECKRNLIKDKKLKADSMDRLVEGMKAMYPYATIDLKDYEQLIPVMTNHPKDRHVLAAAVSININVIVTNNVKDFPSDSLKPYFIESQTPDIFVSHVIDLEPETFFKYFIMNNETRRKYARKNDKKFILMKKWPNNLHN